MMSNKTPIKIITHFLSIFPSTALTRQIQQSPPFNHVEKRISHDKDQAGFGYISLAAPTQRYNKDSNIHKRVAKSRRIYK